MSDSQHSLPEKNVSRSKIFYTFHIFNIISQGAERTKAHVYLN